MYDILPMTIGSVLILWLIIELRRIKIDLKFLRLELATMRREWTRLDRSLAAIKQINLGNSVLNEAGVDLNEYGTSAGVDPTNILKIELPQTPTATFDLEEVSENSPPSSGVKGQQAPCR